MAAYGEAKARLFTDYSVRHRVINADDAFGSQLIARHYPNVVTYGMQGGEVRGRIVRTDRESMLLQIHSVWGNFEATIAAVGKFNAYNALAIAASLLCRNVSVKRVVHALQSLRAAPGRMQRVNSVATNEEPSVYVDYAHTPDALEKAIAASREACTGALWVVFGCGGDRDATKRPVMGAIAAQGADVAIVTSDNPRTESPSAIISQILSGFPASRRARVEEIVDRRVAILRAIHAAANDDTVLIAGKGHEDYQEIGGERIHFSDIEVAARALAERNVAMEKSHATH
jgi:UDP-N-acetylmuramoyl-L-alanyl-D-glutamate--2,6-diaminopimelate ligase